MDIEASCGCIIPERAECAGLGYPTGCYFKPILEREQMQAEIERLRAALEAIKFAPSWEAAVEIAQTVNEQNAVKEG